MQCEVGACYGLVAGGDERRGCVGPILRAACIYGEQASSILWQWGPLGGPSWSSVVHWGSLSAVGYIAWRAGLVWIG